jgi:hypothetical protein
VSLASATTLKQLLDTTAPDRCDDPELGQVRANGIEMAVCWRMNRCRVRWRVKQLCCSGVLVGTKRMFRPGDGFANRFRASRIVLMSLT